MEQIIIATGGVLLGSVMSYFLTKPRSKIIEEAAQKSADQIRKTSELESERLLADGRKQIEHLRENARREEVQVRERLEKMQLQADERLQKRELVLEQKIEKVENSREEYEEKQKKTEDKTKELDLKIGEQNNVLSDISGLSKEDAKERLLEQLEKEYSNDLAKVLHKKVELARTNADEEASNIIVQSIQRYAAPVTNESTVSVVKLDSDDLKGKIIGREGRNINAFEMMTGVDLIVDDTPGTITISCFDMFRRYVAKIALENLIKDGRIHPSKIEEMIKKAQEQADKLILEIGQKAAYDLGITGIPEQVLKLIGRLRFRTSYGQNVLQHSIEVAYLAEAIANELPGADPELCKKAGLLHDIGKAVSHEVEGGHALIGKEILEKFGVDPKVVSAMKSHHEDFPYETIESRILQAADAISAARPGARRETLEKYLKRLKELEAIASGFTGVDKVFAIQAGREVRIFVNAGEMDDLSSEKLSLQVAKKIEENCEYPGEVRVAVIRENRFEAVAK
jgi:ribonuclease Y